MRPLQHIRAVRHAPIAAGLVLIALAGCSRSGQNASPGGSDAVAVGTGVTPSIAYQGQSIPVDLGSVATTSVTEASSGESMGERRRRKAPSANPFKVTPCGNLPKLGCGVTNL